MSGAEQIQTGTRVGPVVTEAAVQDRIRGEDCENSRQAAEKGAKTKRLAEHLEKMSQLGTFSVGSRRFTLTKIMAIDLSGKLP
jgi:hypothetical protein